MNTYSDEELVIVNDVIAVEKLTQAIERLEELNMYSGDLQELLSKYTTQLIKEVSDYSNVYDAIKYKQLNN